MGIFDNVFETDIKKDKNKQQSFGKKVGNKLKEFKEEFSENLSEFDNQPYRNNGVILTKMSDHTATVKYDGLLAQYGADDVYTVIGYGSNSNWENVQTIRMNRIGNTFQADIQTIPGTNVNIAFKDSADHWDNNSGMNYTFI
ncbi:MAG: carbohydrate-binding family 25 protein [Clostridiaceae bacterium]|nr:carbohydrate-binding family 25 protein [Clostridiaceae bacterium]